MKRLVAFFLTVALCLSAFLMCEKRAYAYVDPGSGLLIFQVAGALITGSVLWFRRRLRNLFGRSPEVSPEPDQPQKITADL